MIWWYLIWRYKINLMLITAIIMKANKSLSLVVDQIMHKRLYLIHKIQAFQQKLLKWELKTLVFLILRNLMNTKALKIRFINKELINQKGQRKMMQFYLLLLDLNNTIQSQRWQLYQRKKLLHLQFQSKQWVVCDRHLKLDVNMDKGFKKVITQIRLWVLLQL